VTVDNVPCGLCDERVYLDEPHVKLTAEYQGTGDRDEVFAAHIECVDGLEEPEP